MDILLPTLKDPNNLEANNLMTRISETLKLRGADGLSAAERAQVLTLADPGFKPGMSDAQKLQALKASNAALVKFFADHPDVLARRGVLETLISAMGRIEQDSALSTSGVVGNKKGDATPVNQREMKPGRPGPSQRSPLAPGAAPVPGMMMPAPVGP